MDLFAPKHLMLVLLIVLLVFGGKKIKTLGSDLGAALRGFKKSMAEGETEPPASVASASTVPAVGLEAPVQSPARATKHTVADL